MKEDGIRDQTQRILNGMIYIEVGACVPSEKQRKQTHWSQLGAWIEIKTPKDYGLSGGIPLSRFYDNVLSLESEAYVVSMFHQIHCVVRSQLVRATSFN